MFIKIIILGMKIINYIYKNVIKLYDKSIKKKFIYFFFRVRENKLTIKLL